MSLEIKSVQQVNAEKQKVFLIYGKSGTGKTKFIGTVPKKTLVLDINEGGTQTLEDKENVIVAKINTYQDLVDFMKNFQKYHDEYKFDNIVLDTIDHLQGYYIRDVIKKEKPNFEDWGKWNTAFATMLTFFRGIAQESKIKVFYLAHEKDWSKIDGDHKVDRDITANLSQGTVAKVNAMADVIMNMELRDFPKKNAQGKAVLDKTTGRTAVISQYIGIIKGSTTKVTKFRTSLKKLEEHEGEFYFKNPTYSKIQKIYELEKKQNKK